MPITAKFPLVLLRPEEVAARLGVRIATLAKWRVQGRGPKFARLGGGSAIAYREDHLLEFIEGCSGFRSTTEADAHRAA
jgi:hypothetical protein